MDFSHNSFNILHTINLLLLSTEPLLAKSVGHRLQFSLFFRCVDDVPLMLHIEDCPPFRTCFVDGFCGTTVVSKFPLGMGVVAQKDKSLAGPTVVHDTGILMLSRAR